MSHFNLGEFITGINKFFYPENLLVFSDGFFNILISQQLQDNLFLLKIIFLFFSLVFLIFIIYFLLTSTFLQAHFLWKLFEIIAFKPYGARRYEREWNKINAFLDKKTEDAYKIAIIEADSFIDQILKRLNIPGKNIEERLKNTSDGQVSNIEDLRDAHNLRNNVVHDPSILVDFDKAKEILGVYEKTLRLLDLI